MKFHEFPEAWAVASKTNLGRLVGSRERLYQLAEVAALKENNALAYHHLRVEQSWASCGMPYYNLWPAILPMLLSFELDVPCSQVTMPLGPDGKPLPALSLRLPADNRYNPLIYQGGLIRSVVFGSSMVSNHPGDRERSPGMILVGDTGEIIDGTPVHLIRSFPLRPDSTIEQALALLPYDRSWYKGVVVPEETITALVRICCCVCLIGNDPDLVTADVLSRDLPAYQDADADRRRVIEERARRRGKYGFNLGEEFEKIPHLRRPHPAKVRYGKGWSMIKTILRKGSVVHRRKMTEIPTGHADEDQPT